MLSKLRQHTLIYYVWWLLVACIFNSSVDTPDVAPWYMAEDLSYNDMESIVEIVTEECLHIDNFVVEYDEAGDEENTPISTKKMVDVYTLPIIKLPTLFFLSPNNTPVATFFHDKLSPQFVATLLSPPPEA